MVECNIDSKLKEPLIKKDKVNYETQSESEYLCTYSNLITKIGLNKKLLFSYIIACLCQFSSGSETFFLLLHLEKLGRFQNISTNIISLGLFLSFFSEAIGGILMGYLSFKFGRVNTILYTSILYYIFTTLCSIYTNFIIIILFRMIGNIFIGMFLTPSFNLLSEYLPIKNRGLNLMIVSTFFNLGTFWVIIINFIFATGPSIESNFQICNYFCCISGIFIAIIAFFFLEESPIYYFSRKNEKKAFELIKNMIQTSKNSHLDLTEKEKYEITKEISKKKGTNLKSSFYELFTEEYWKLCVVLILIESLVYSNIVGIGFLVPQTVENKNFVNFLDPNVSLIIYGIIQIPIGILGGYISENKHFGRIRTIQLSSIVCFVLYIFILFQSEYISIFAGLITLFTGISVGICLIYSTESYPTKIRDKGLGFNYFMTSLVSSSIPYVIMNFGSSDTMLNYYFLGLSQLFILIFSFLLPFETRKRPLDYEKLE